MDDEPAITPLMGDQPEDEEELQARRRRLTGEAGRDMAIRGAAAAGEVGGNAGPVAGSLTGRAWLGIEEADVEEAVEPRLDEERRD
jgi:hypothetical protein